MRGQLEERHRRHLRWRARHRLWRSQPPPPLLPPVRGPGHQLRRRFGEGQLWLPRQRQRPPPQWRPLRPRAGPHPCPSGLPSMALASRSSSNSSSNSPQLQLLPLAPLSQGRECVATGVSERSPLSRRWPQFAGAAPDHARALLRPPTSCPLLRYGPALSPGERVGHGPHRHSQPCRCTGRAPQSPCRSRAVASSRWPPLQTHLHHSRLAQLRHSRGPTARHPRGRMAID